MNLRVNQLNKIFFPEITTSFPGNDNKIYLTFDDGPTPGITNQVLAFLLEYNAKATFFCRGDRVKENTTLYREILEQGHTVGNHTFSHLNGWYYSKNKYAADCYKATKLIQSRIFRPPFGKIRPSQYQLLKKDYTIYLWTALSWDFHPWVSPERCLNYSMKHLLPGSILVFHDNEKASSKLIYALPRILKAGTDIGLEFCAIPSSD